jgi:hypothetical protein
MSEYSTANDTTHNTSEAEPGYSIANYKTHDISEVQPGYSTMY